MNAPRGFLTGGVSHCWHCNRQLVRKPGRFLFVVLLTQDEREVRVHKQCVAQSVGDGVKEKKS